MAVREGAQRPPMRMCRQSEANRSASRSSTALSLAHRPRSPLAHPATPARQGTSDPTPARIARFGRPARSQCGRYVEIPHPRPRSLHTRRTLRLRTGRHARVYGPRRWCVGRAPNTRAYEPTSNLLTNKHSITLAGLFLRARTPGRSPGAALRGARVPSRQGMRPRRLRRSCTCAPMSRRPRDNSRQRSIDRRQPNVAIRGDVRYPSTK